jgi:hypothetical protein
MRYLVYAHIWLICTGKIILSYSAKHRVFCTTDCRYKKYKFTLGTKCSFKCCFKLMVLWLKNEKKYDYLRINFRCICHQGMTKFWNLLKILRFSVHINTTVYCEIILFTFCAWLNRSMLCKHDPNDNDRSTLKIMKYVSYVCMYKNRPDFLENHKNCN